MLTNEAAPRSSAEWILPVISNRAVSKLAGQLGISSLVARILASRGMTDPVVCRNFLEPCQCSLFDPMLLADMDVAVKRIARALRRGERILVYGDYDVDGICSLAILKYALQLLGGTVDVHVPHRLWEGYGLQTKVITEAAGRGVTLLVTVDTGIRSREAVSHARSLGLDVIVTDHHLPETELPAAIAVVNPNRSDCAYPNKALCGAGVTWKLIQALLRQSAIPVRRQQLLLESLLKPVAIATVADVVPLLGENRSIVRADLLA